MFMHSVALYIYMFMVCEKKMKKKYLVLIVSTECEFRTDKSASYFHAKTCETKTDWIVSNINAVMMQKVDRNCWE